MNAILMMNLIMMMKVINLHLAQYEPAITQPVSPTAAPLQQFLGKKYYFRYFLRNLVITTVDYNIFGLIVLMKAGKIHLAAAEPPTGIHRPVHVHLHLQIPPTVPHFQP